MIRRAFYHFLVLITLLAASPSAQADKPTLQLPVACDLGSACWVVNYVDTDPEKDVVRDFRCEARSYDEHNGTDFGIADQVSMEMGVPVLAAADGTVLRMRDGVEDKVPTEQERLALLADNKGCGNGVLIDHGGGWQTIYCHMKQGSITVKPNQKIRAGEKLGQIGHSGATEFPHLHFGVSFEGTPIDPFTGNSNQDGCGKSRDASLWVPSLNLSYEPFSIYAAGFHAGAPDFDAIKIDARGASSLGTNSEALVFWAALFGVTQGDKIYLEITDPAGRIFSRREITQEKTRARQFYFVGRRVHDAGLSNGTYTGTIKVVRQADNGPAQEKVESRTVTIK